MELERDKFKGIIDSMKRKLKELEESESGMRVALEKAERDASNLKVKNNTLAAMFSDADAEAKKSIAALKTLDSKFKVRICL